MQQSEGWLETGQPGKGEGRIAAWGGEAGLGDGRKPGFDLELETDMGRELGKELADGEAMGVLPGRVSWMETTFRRWLPATISQKEHGRGDSAAQMTKPEGLAMLAHDVRNMLTALELYCDLLEEPGVLEPPFRHYAGELRMVAGASRNLIQKLGALDQQARQKAIPVAGIGTSPGSGLLSGSEVAVEQESGLSRIGTAWPWSPSPVRMEAERLTRLGRRRIPVQGQMVENLAEELLANKSLLTAMAGPGITVGMHFDGGARPIGLHKEDLTRVLVNLVKNSSEAMPGGGHIQIGVEEDGEALCLSVSDTGWGIPEVALEEVFAPGYTTHLCLDSEENMLPAQHRGLGLAIVRSLVAAAGGAVWAGNKANEKTGVRSGLTMHREAEATCGEAANRGQTGCSGTGGTGAIVCLEFPVNR